MSEEQEFNSENEGNEEVQQEKGGKRTGLKIIIGLIILILLAGIVVWRTTDFFEVKTQNTYQDTLSDYYLALSKNDTNTLKLLISSDFKDYTSISNLKAGQYQIYAYHISDYTVTGNEPTNYSVPDKTILFSLIVHNQTPSISQLNTAHFKSAKTGIVISMISNLYTGTSIDN